MRDSAPSWSSAEDDDSLKAVRGTQAGRDEPEDARRDLLMDGEGSEEEEDVSPSQKLWPVRAILGEKKHKYLLEWEDIDPATGRAYALTWESKDNATAELVAEWEAHKKANKTRTITKPSSSSTTRASSTKPLSRKRPAPPSSSDNDEQKDDAHAAKEKSEKGKGKRVAFDSPLVASETGRARKKMVVVSDEDEEVNEGDSVETTMVPDSQSGPSQVEPEDDDEDVKEESMDAGEKSAPGEASGSRASGIASVLVEDSDQPLTQEASEELSSSRAAELALIDLSATTDESSQEDAQRPHSSSNLLAAAKSLKPVPPIPRASAFFPAAGALSQPESSQAESIQDPDSPPTVPRTKKVTLSLATSSRRISQPALTSPIASSSTSFTSLPRPPQPRHLQLSSTNHHRRRSSTSGPTKVAILTSLPSPSQADSLLSISSHSSLSSNNSRNSSQSSIGAVTTGRMRGPLVKSRGVLRPFGSGAVTSVGVLVGGAGGGRGLGFGRDEEEREWNDEMDEAIGGGDGITGWGFDGVRFAGDLRDSDNPPAGSGFEGGGGGGGGGGLAPTSNGANGAAPVASSGGVGGEPRTTSTGAVPSVLMGSYGNGAGNGHGGAAGSGGGGGGPIPSGLPGSTHGLATVPEPNPVPTQPLPVVPQLAAAKRDLDSTDPSDDTLAKKARTEEGASAADIPVNSPIALAPTPVPGRTAPPSGISLPPPISATTAAATPVAMPANTAALLSPPARAATAGVPTNSGPLSPMLSRVLQSEPFIIPNPAQNRSTSPAVPASPSSAAASPAAGGPAPVAAVMVAAPSPAPQSRNASPAPGGGAGLPALMDLIRASAHIVDTDRTKAELLRFVQSPSTYSTLPDTPLNKRALWAFELRKIGTEKTDLIIINITEGTYQLKRVPLTLAATLDVARSLSHSSSRAPAGTTRPATPVGDIPVTPAAAPSPVPVAVAPASAPAPAPAAAPAAAPSAASLEPVKLTAAQMSREQLEREYEALLAESKELAALRPLATEVVKLRADVAALTKSNRSLAASKESAASDFAYIQRQYSEASNAAVARANEATVAEAEASRLRGQLETGLVQHKMFFEGQVKSCKTEIGMLKGQIAILKREKERTEAAGVREKAALWDDHVAREAIKGKGEEESEEEEEVKDPSTLEDSLGGTSSQSLSQSQSQSQVFVCEWRNSPATVCGSTVKTREELQDHLVAAHIPPVSTISQG